MNRIKNILKNYGVLGTITRIIKKIMYRFFRFFDDLDNAVAQRYKKAIEKRLKIYYKFIEKKCFDPKYKKVFVFHPYVEWDIPTFQRPQQIALALSKRNDVLYLYCTLNFNYDKITNLYKEINENLYVVNDYDFIINLPMKNRILHLYANNIMVTESDINQELKRNNKILYEYVDELHEDITYGVSKEVLDRHQRILTNEDCHVIVTADKLYDDVKIIRKKRYALSTNGVHIEDFARPVDEIPEQLKELKSQYEKIICYYGALAVWFDYELLIKCAKKYSHYVFILIGLIYDGSFEKNKVLQYKNIVYLGIIPYKNLINYTKYSDLLTIPFLINEITESTSPVKLFEYMATQKPILSTAMKECMKYKSVIIGKDHNDYVERIDSTINLIRDEKYLDLLMREALENTWDSKAQVIIDLLDNEYKEEINEKIKVMSIFGTRPEAIKMAPLVKELEKRKEIESIVCVTAQHRQMLDQVLDTFNIKPDYDLNIMKQGQTLGEVTTRALNGLEEAIKNSKPDIVLVHGDTVTTLAGALAAFYNQVAIGHVEAGLRTNDKYSPWPEEMNRQMVDCMADMYFAPTKLSKENLLIENKPEDKIFVTGNTAIDAMATTVQKDYTHEVLNWASGARLILLTAHRRENLGRAMRNIFKAIKRIADEFEDIKIVYPIHMNPKVRETANEILGTEERIKLIEPLEVFDFHNFINKSYIILTDSGGIQEEAPSLGKPVLVLRDTTERPEGIEAGTLKLVGTNEDDIYNETKKLLVNEAEYAKMSRASNPYGDGFASKRIVDAIIEKYLRKQEIAKL